MKFSYTSTLLLITALTSSCTKQGMSSFIKNDDMLTVEVGVDTDGSNESDTQESSDTLQVGVGIDTVDPSKPDDGSVQVGVGISTKPLDPPTDAPPQNPDDDASSLEEDKDGVYIFVDWQGADIRLSMSAKRQVERLEICLGDKRDCLEKKPNLKRLAFDKNGEINGRALFDSYQAPSTDTVWTIYAKDSDNKTLFYRAIKIN